MSDFNEAPKKNKRAVIWWGNSTYGSIDKVDGEQPYYTYQGIGSLTGQNASLSVTHNTLQVTYNGESVIHT